MNCPNCGRPLADGEVCNCLNENFNAPVQPEAAQVNSAPVYEGQPAQQAYANPSQQAPYADPAQQYAYQQPPYYAPQAPVPAPVARTDYPEGYKPKRKYAAVILAVTLGQFGIHNFYLGNKNKALTQLLICLIGSIFAGLGAIAAWIWAIVDAVELLTDKQDMDANGFKIQTFEEALVAERIKAEMKMLDEE